METNDHIKALHDLHELIGDSRKGYEDAAGQVDSVPLGQFLHRLSAQRASMQAELAAEIRRLRPTDKLEDGTAKGSLHRTWMEIREALGRSDDANMLDECERGEQYLLQRFDTVREEQALPPSTKQLLAIQRQQVQENLAQVKQLHAAANAAH